MASQIRQKEGTPQQHVSPPPPQGIQVGSLIQQRDEEEGGDDEEYAYATENLLYDSMHDEEINLDLNK